MKPFAIAGIQMKVSAVASNVEMMKLKIDITMNLYPWIEMIMFSELCAYGPLTHTAQPIPNNFEAEMQAKAKEYGIWLLPGSIFEKSDDKIYNTATVINPKGEIVTRYRKMFPFYPYETGVTPGEHYCVFDVPNVARFGVSICYDMWFPETIRTLATMGAEVIMHPIVCGPDGRVLHQSEGTEEIIPLELNIERARRSRELGILRLGQPLKSFRDHLKSSHFGIYQPNLETPYLDSLGPLIKPSRLDKITALKIKENELEQKVSTIK